MDTVMTRVALEDAIKVAVSTVMAIRRPNRNKAARRPRDLQAGIVPRWDRDVATSGFELARATELARLTSVQLAAFASKVLRAASKDDGSEGIGTAGGSPRLGSRGGAEAYPDGRHPAEGGGGGQGTPSPTISDSAANNDATDQATTEAALSSLDAIMAAYMRSTGRNQSTIDLESAKKSAGDEDIIDVSTNPGSEMIITTANGNAAVQSHNGLDKALKIQEEPGLKTMICLSEAVQDVVDSTATWFETLDKWSFERPSVQSTHALELLSIGISASNAYGNSETATEFVTEFGSDLAVGFAANVVAGAAAKMLMRATLNPYVAAASGVAAALATDLVAEYARDTLKSVNSYVSDQTTELAIYLDREIRNLYAHQRYW
jgi:hypothetical protein